MSKQARTYKLETIAKAVEDEFDLHPSFFDGRPCPCTACDRRNRIVAFIRNFGRVQFGKKQG